MPQSEVVMKSKIKKIIKISMVVLLTITISFIVIGFYLTKAHMSHFNGDIEFSPDGKYLAISTIRKFNLYNTDRWKKENELKNQNFILEKRIFFSENSKYLFNLNFFKNDFIFDPKKYVRVDEPYDILNKKFTGYPYEKNFFIIQPYILCFAKEDNNKTNNLIRLMERVEEKGGILRKIQKQEHIIYFHTSRENDELYVNAEIHDLATGKVINKIQVPGKVIEDRVFVGGNKIFTFEERTLKLIDIESLQVREIPIAEYHKAFVSYDGKKFITILFENPSVIIHIGNTLFEDFSTLNFYSINEEKTDHFAMNFKERVEHVAIHPDSNLVALGYQRMLPVTPSRVVIMDWDTRKFIRDIKL
jgi:hypothetical protein